MPILPHLWRYADTFEYLERLRVGLPPLIISLTANGAIRGPEYSEHIPETVDEIAHSVADAYEAGASMVHLHARDRTLRWRGAVDPESWYELHRAVRRRCPHIVINASTEGDPGMTLEERTACLAARPEVASLNVAPEMRRTVYRERTAPPAREAIAVDRCTAITYGEVRGLAQAMKDRGIKPELEVKHLGGLQVVRDLIAERLVEPPYLVQTVMGYPAGNYGTVASVLDFLRDFPEDAIWFCMGKDETQLPLTTLAILMGGHVRVGLEDNLYVRPGVKGTNADFVRRTARLCRELNREVATPAEAREMLGLAQTPSEYP